MRVRTCLCVYVCMCVLLTKTLENKIFMPSLYVPIQYIILRLDTKQHKYVKIVCVYIMC